MKPLDFPILTDENIAPDVVAGLLARGCDLRTAWDEHLIGRPDVDVLECATNQGRVVVTHDVAAIQGTSIPVVPECLRLGDASTTSTRFPLGDVLARRHRTVQFVANPTQSEFPTIPCSSVACGKHSMRKLDYSRSVDFVPLYSTTTARDSSLLQDGVRVLTPTMQRASAALGDARGRLRNRLRSVGRRVLVIGR